MRPLFEALESRAVRLCAMMLSATEHFHPNQILTIVLHGTPDAPLKSVFDLGAL